MVSRRSALTVAYEIWRAKRSGPAAILSRQQKRLQALIEFARTHSPFYQRLYQHLPAQITSLADLPPVTKHDLMAHFDEWGTDPEIKLDSVSAFIADTSLVGQSYLGRYAVWRTSGTTGSPGIFLHDADAMLTYIALLLVRGYFSWITPGSFWQFMRQHWRTAFIFATGGHFASNTSIAVANRLRPGSSKTSLLLSVHMPLPDLVQALNDFQPVILETYPSVLAALTHEQASGRLRIRPLIISTGGECLKSLVRQQAAEVFECIVRDVYAASEFMGIASDCQYERLHVNSDWVILEPVDAAYRPRAPGSPPHTVLLTNLANRVQPIIRYEMGDSVSFRVDSCPCGSPLPSIVLEGRDDEILSFETDEGRPIDIMPLPLAAIVMVTAGVQRFQLVQTHTTTLSVRLEAAPGARDEQVWQSVRQRLEEYLTSQGLPSVQIERSIDPPHQQGVTGKFRHVWSECKSPQPIHLIGETES